MFCLNYLQIEQLANKAGLSLHNENKNILYSDSTSEFSNELSPDLNKIHLNKSDSNINTDFSKHFNFLLSRYNGKNVNLYTMSSISERMFRHIKSGKYLRKEAVLALLITLELDIDDIQIALKKAGLILSSSIASDAIIIWLLGNEVKDFSGVKRLLYINEILYSLKLPILGTRDKVE